MFGQTDGWEYGMKRQVCGSLGSLWAVLLFVLAQGIAVSALAKDAAINVPELIQIRSGIETPLAIEIRAAESIPPKAMVLIRGIPSTASLTDGRLFPSGIWVVKPASVDELRLITTSSATEDARLTISLVTLEGDNLSSASARLIVSPNGGLPQTPDNAVPSVAVAHEKNDAVSAIPPAVNGGAKPEIVAPQNPPRVLWSEGQLEKMLKLMERGDRYLTEGKIDFARRFYQMVAEMGSPEGAEAVARTYDPDYLRRFPIVGAIAPDQAKAQEWYNKAKEIRTSFEKNFQNQVGRN
jgi:hypothetical protein